MINVVDTVVTAVEVGGKIIDLKDEIEGIKKVLEKLPNDLKEIAGDAATGPLMVAWLARLMPRVDGPGHCGLIHLSGDGGERSAVVVSYRH